MHSTPGSQDPDSTEPTESHSSSSESGPVVAANLHTPIRPPNGFACMHCGTKADPRRVKKSFLLFPKFTCKNCKAKNFYPASKGAQILHWVLALVFVAVFIVGLAARTIMMPGVIFIAGFWGIFADMIIRHKLRIHDKPELARVNKKPVLTKKNSAIATGALAYISGLLFIYFHVAEATKKRLVPGSALSYSSMTLDGVEPHSKNNIFNLKSSASDNLDPWSSGISYNNHNQRDVWLDHGDGYFKGIIKNNSTQYSLKQLKIQVSIHDFLPKGDRAIIGQSLFVIHCHIPPSHARDVGEMVIFPNLPEPSAEAYWDWEVIETRGE